MRSGFRLSREEANQPCAGSDAEFRIDAREVTLDRAHGDRERCCNLLIRVAFGDELSNSPFPLGQRAVRWLSPADSCELVLRSHGPNLGAKLLESCVRFF